jgi:hypothetical protein
VLRRGQRLALQQPGHEQQRAEPGEHDEDAAPAHHPAELTTEHGRDDRRQP